jgi:hypothetical protein
VARAGRSARRAAPQVTGSVELLALLGHALLIVSAVLVLRVLVVTFRNDQT